MEIETINPFFMRALLKCHMFQQQARKKVSHNRRFFKQVLKVFKWQRRIRRKIGLNKSSAGYPPEDIVRRNLWLMIVRKDIVQAHRRKVALREQKLLKARIVAHRCLSHFEQFQKQHSRDKPLE